MRLVIYVNILIYVSDGKFFLMETSDTSKQSKLGIDYLDEIPPKKCENNQDLIVHNLELALRGYNAVEGDQFSENGDDPGFKNQIFKGSYYDKDAGATCVYNNIKQYAAINCGDFSKRGKYRTIQKYQEAKSGAIENSVEVGLSLGVDVLFGLISNFKSTFSTTYGQNTTFSKEKKFFNDFKGEIYLNEARCQVFTVRINKLKPNFTEEFLSALKNLENAAKSPESDKSRKAIKDFFTNNFGTHYLDDTDMGASMTTENR